MKEFKGSGASHTIYGIQKFINVKYLEIFETEFKIFFILSKYLRFYTHTYINTNTRITSKYWFSSDHQRSPGQYLDK